MGNAFHPEARGEGGDAGMIDLNKRVSSDDWNALTGTVSVEINNVDYGYLHVGDRTVENSFHLDESPLEDDLADVQDWVGLVTRFADSVGAEVTWDDEWPTLTVQVERWDEDGVGGCLDQISNASLIEFWEETR